MLIIHTINQQQQKDFHIIEGEFIVGRGRRFGGGVGRRDWGAVVGRGAGRGGTIRVGKGPAARRLFVSEILPHWLGYFYLLLMQRSYWCILSWWFCMSWASTDASLAPFAVFSNRRLMEWGGMRGTYLLLRGSSIISSVSTFIFPFLFPCIYLLGANSVYAL